MSRLFGLCLVLLASCLPWLASPAVADPAVSHSRAVPQARIAVGGWHTCAVLSSGAVRCWGFGFDGELGYGDKATIGDGETPASAGDVPLDGTAVAVAAGLNHTCALMATGSVRCWGLGDNGRLGYGNTITVGDDETPASVGDVPLGGPAKAIAAGGSHTCALMATGTVRCWGLGGSGRLGYGNTTTIGDNEPPANAGDVPLGGTALAIDVGAAHSCALMSTGAVRCWGLGGSGRLGYGNAATVGDGETPAEVGDVPLGGTAVGITAGDDHTCAAMATGGVRCWGNASHGKLGYGTASNIGDGETPAEVGDVPLGGAVVAVAAGRSHTCATMAAGGVRCWGQGGFGALGYGAVGNIGDDEPANAGDVPLGGTAIAIGAGNYHTCASLSTGAVRCWGYGYDGMLGYAGRANIGDDETPASVGDVAVGAPLARLRSDVSLGWSAVEPLALDEESSATLTVTESGPEDATDVTVVVRAPGVADLGSVAASRGSYDPATGVWRIPVLRGSATLTLPFTAAHPGAGSFDAVAYTTSVDPEQIEAGYPAALKAAAVHVDGIAGPTGPAGAAGPTGAAGPAGQPGPPGADATPVFAILGKTRLRAAPRTRVRVGYLATTTTPLTVQVSRGAKLVRQVVVTPPKAGRNAFVLVAPKATGRYQLRLRTGGVVLDQGRLVVGR